MLLELFFTFMKIGMFTFGGGYAMISVVENACVEDKHWITHDDMMNITVIAESTPGPIIGAAVATTGMILPSFLIIYLVARFLDSFLEISWIAHAFEGIKLAVGILIIDAGIKMLRQIPARMVPRLILACAFAAMLLIDILALRISSIALLLIAAAVSLVLFTISQNIEREGSQ